MLLKVSVALWLSRRNTLFCAGPLDPDPYTRIKTGQCTETRRRLAQYTCMGSYTTLIEEERNKLDRLDSTTDLQLGVDQKASETALDTSRPKPRHSVLQAGTDIPFTQQRIPDLTWSTEIYYYICRPTIVTVVCSSRWPGHQQRSPRRDRKTSR